MLERIEHGRVLELRLNRPPVNALDEALLRALRDGVQGVDAGAVVISGQPRMFSAGLDVPALLRLDRAGIGSVFQALADLMLALAESRVPVVAAMTGHSPAGGTVIGLFCDYRIMADGAFRLGLNEVEVGLPVPVPIHFALARLTGERIAERLCVEGRMLEAGEAVRIGLVDELAPVDAVIERALEWCERLLALPAAAMTRSREVARAGLRRAMREGVPSSAALADVWFSEETQEAMRAMMARHHRS